MKAKWRKWVSLLKQDRYALYLASRDRRVPYRATMLLFVVMAYALSPIDLIADFVLVLGYLDDMVLFPLGWIFHEVMLRDLEDGRATGEPEGAGSEAYLNSTSQEPTPEDAQEDGRI